MNRRTTLALLSGFPFAVCSAAAAQEVATLRVLGPPNPHSPDDFAAWLSTSTRFAL